MTGETRGKRDVAGVVRQAVVRVVDGENGRSMLVDQELPLVRTEGRAGVFWTAALGRADLTLLRLPRSFASSVHAMGSPAWLLVLEGDVEVEVSGEIRKLFSPGAIIRFEDVAGRGHRLRGSASGDALVAIARSREG